MFVVSNFASCLHENVKMFTKFLVLFVLKHSSRDYVDNAGKQPIFETNCRWYSTYALDRDEENSMDATKLCPTNTRFNPRSQSCDAEYICTEYLCSEEIFYDGHGDTLYRDPNDTNGTEYISCVYNDRHKRYVPSFRTCPEGKKFVVEESTKYDKGSCLKVETVKGVSTTNYFITFFELLGVFLRFLLILFSHMFF